MAKTTRTFVALPVPMVLGDKLTRLQELLATEGSQRTLVVQPSLPYDTGFPGRSA